MLFNVLISVKVNQKNVFLFFFLVKCIVIQLNMLFFESKQKKYYFYSREMDNCYIITLFNGTFKYALCRYGSEQCCSQNCPIFF